MSLKCLASNLTSCHKRAGRPAVEIVHFHEQADLAVFFDQAFHRGNEMFVIFLGKFAGQLDFQHLAAVGFFERHGAHFCYFTHSFILHQ